MNGRSPTGLTLPQSNEISSSWWPLNLDMSLFPPSDGTYAIIPPGRQASGRRPSYTVHCPVTPPSRLSPKMLGLPHLRDCVSRVLISHACAREHTHAQTRTRKHTCAHIHIHANTHAHMHTHYAHVQAHTQIHPYKHTHTRTCTHYMHTQIHTHTHAFSSTHTRTHKRIHAHSVIVNQKT